MLTNSAKTKILKIKPKNLMYQYMCDVIDEILKIQDSVKCTEIKYFMETELNIKVRSDLLPISLYGKDYILDCKT